MDRSAAEARGDLAEALVPLAAELAFLVRDEGRNAIGEWLDTQGITGEKARALLVVTAAMVPIDATEDDLLAWLTWDEHGAPLDGTIPLLPCLPVPAEPPSVPPQPAAGAAIFAARTAAGMSQRELARRAGVNHKTIREWEFGRQAVRLGNWLGLKAVLGPLGVSPAAARAAAAETGDAAA